MVFGFDVSTVELRNSCTHEGFNNYKCDLSRQDELGSTGSAGKFYDPYGRDRLYINGIRNPEDVRCRRLGRPDAKGKYGVIEFKTGAGAVYYTHGGNATWEDVREENICKGVDLIVWLPFPKEVTCEEELTTKAWVLSREEFIAALVFIGKNGLRSSLKCCKNEVMIQNLNPVPARKLKEFLADKQTFAEFLKVR